MIVNSERKTGFERNKKGLNKTKVCNKTGEQRQLPRRRGRYRKVHKKLSVLRRTFPKLILGGFWMSRKCVSFVCRERQCTREYIA